MAGLFFVDFVVLEENCNVLEDGWNEFVDKLLLSLVKTLLECSCLIDARCLVEFLVDVKLVVRFVNWLVPFNEQDPSTIKSLNKLVALQLRFSKVGLF